MRDRFRAFKDVLKPDTMTGMPYPQTVAVTVGSERLSGCGGDPAARLKAAGIKAHVAGENVANANSLENAHRALWASPSHRGNLLLDQFTRVGVSVIRAPDGMVWVTQMFAG